MLEHVLYSIRMRAGLTQQEVADRAATTIQYVSMLEKGIRLPSMKMIGRLSLALEVPSDTLLKAAMVDGTPCPHEHCRSRAS